MPNSDSIQVPDPLGEDVPHGYRAALERAVFQPRMDVGVLALHGPDRIDFLQRQSTNDLRPLAPDRAVETVLTSAKARIMDVLTLLSDGEILLAVTLPGQGAQTAEFLRGRIFFMDDVRVDAAGADRVVIDVLGPSAAEVLASTASEGPPEEGQVQGMEIAGAPVLVAGMRGLFGPAYRLLAPVRARGEILAWLRGAGADPLAPEAYQVLRVEAGRPEAGHELTEAFTPLEAGLPHLIAADKGCYTGQEVIARQLTYDKVTRHLAGLELDGDAAAGARVWAEGRAAGEITSVADSPRFGRIALGILRRPHHEPGGQVRVGEEDDGTPARVVPLPFGS